MQASDPAAGQEADQVQNSKYWRRCNAVCMGMVVLAFVVLSLFRIFFWSTHPLLIYADQSACLETGMLLLAGKRPYIDFWEVNPPMIMYINMIPAIVARLFHIPPTEGLSISIETFAFLNTAFAAYIAYRARAVSNFVVLLPAFFAFAYYTQLLDSDLGQREHLFVLTYLPFLIVRGVHWMGGPVGRVEAILAGLIGGIGLALKPHFVFAALVTDLAFFYQYRRPSCFLRPEVLTAASLLVVYGASLLLLPREAIDIFMKQAVPIYNIGIYATSKCLMHMVRCAPIFWIPFFRCFVAVAIGCWLRDRSPWITPVVVFTCAAFANYFQGDQAWTYRLLPMIFGSFLLLGLEAGIFLQWLLRRFENFAGPRLLLSLALLLWVFSMAYESVDAINGELALAQGFDLAKVGYSGTIPRASMAPVFFAIVSNSKVGDKVVPICTATWPCTPAILQSGRMPGTRYLFCILGLLDYCQEKKGGHVFQDMIHNVVDNYVEDIRKNQPALVIIDEDGMRINLEKFSFYDRCMDDYQFLGKTEGFSIFRRIGSQKVFFRTPVASREQLILSVLAGQKTEDQACAELKMDKKTLQDWLVKSRAALTEALTVRAADKMQDMAQENERLNNRIHDLEQEKKDLILESERQQMMQLPADQKPAK